MSKVIERYKNSPSLEEVSAEMNISCKIWVIVLTLVEPDSLANLILLKD